ncbi:MAG: radical SAM family heme chaperone HemW [Kiritimatiellae bacterium]|nr:radical SAM family heme chaperone HemW [Kiritimatiellia bacterium]
MNPRPDSRRRGLYIHAPFCDGKCFYCAFYSRPYESTLARRYLSALETELKQRPPLVVETVYFGGGTPTVFSSSELRELCRIVARNVSLTGLKEWTVEANPGSLTPGKLDVLAAAGVNRISLGAQSFDDAALKWLGRRHTAADIYKAVRMVKSAGFDNFGMDIIACIPGFPPDTWRQTISAVVALGPKHISVYALTVEEGARLAAGAPSKKRAFRLLSEDEELADLYLAEKILADAGYEHYEISNYARPGFECRHNVACWRGGEYIGIGPAAASHAGLKRWTNRADLGKYLASLERGEKPPRSVDACGEKTRRIEKVVFGLRLSAGVSAETAAGCEKPLRALRAQGLVACANGCWRLTERGKYLADYVGIEIMTWADRPGGG